MDLLCFQINVRFLLCVLIVNGERACVASKRFHIYILLSKSALAIAFRFSAIEFWFGVFCSLEEAELWSRHQIQGIEWSQQRLNGKMN